MSNATLTIRTDDKTKQQIADFAASIGLSTTSFMLAATMQAVRASRIVLTPDLEPLRPTPYLEKIMREARADRKAGRNIHGPFKNAADMIADLEK
ncbi:MAG TPA: hypothetical protein VK674_06340 [Candidatus Limnocylindria bacterium]|nr:hypothetical protein [Candidatus Limnocylindria bacterium]